ncbi:hypothetical protein CBL_00958 [Carabus blaptoides fortunei]
MSRKKLAFDNFLLERTYVSRPGDNVMLELQTHDGRYRTQLEANGDVAPIVCNAPKCNQANSWLGFCSYKTSHQSTLQATKKVAQHIFFQIKPRALIIHSPNGRNPVAPWKYKQIETVSPSINGNFPRVQKVFVFEKRMEQQYMPGYKNTISTIIYRQQGASFARGNAVTDWSHCRNIHSKTAQGARQRGMDVLCSWERVAPQVNLMPMHCPMRTHAGRTSASAARVARTHALVALSYDNATMKY